MLNANKKQWNVVKAVGFIERFVPIESFFVRKTRSFQSFFKAHKSRGEIHQAEMATFTTRSSQALLTIINIFLSANISHKSFSSRAEIPPILSLA